MDRSQTGIAETITRTAYWFGSAARGIYGPMTFQPNGTVGARHHPNEALYRLDDDGTLSLMTASGKVTSAMSHAPETGAFLPKTGPSHFLVPAFRLGPAPASKLTRRIFINTVPKAGTYLLGKALEIAGYANIGLHLADTFFHDNRGVPEDKIHWDPRSRETNYPAGAVASLLRPGEFALGHLGSAESLDAIRRQGIVLINVIREPRSLLASMYPFKASKVMPTPEDRVWQSMEGVNRLKGYLTSVPIRSWMDQIETMVASGPCLKFEDIAHGHLDRKVVGFALAHHLSGPLSQAVGKKTSTFSNRDRNSDLELFDDPDVRDYLEATGAMNVSRKYWPDPV